MVPMTVLPGDTHARLALDLTGNRASERVLRKIEPDLRPGALVYVPRALLSTRLADTRSEQVALAGADATLWSLTKNRTLRSETSLAATVRNLQRLNGIADPTKLKLGARVRIPRALLSQPRVDGSPALRIGGGYQVTNLKGLDRHAEERDFAAASRPDLRRQGLWDLQLGEREVDLVVVHTTEHRGAPFSNVARYLQRNRLTNYVIDRDGGVHEVVPEAWRSFGSGQSLWEGRYEVDLNAINVELFANTGEGRYRDGITSAQYEGLRRLIAHIRARRPAIHDGRVVTHRMVAMSYKYGTRARKGDPYEFDWSRAGLPDNSQLLDQDVLLGRAKPCTDERYLDRITEGQTAAARMLHAL
jgi:N-acetyl-anhydromuramyl-L-alanine amidase AmpD